MTAPTPSADECFCDQRGLGVKGVSCGDCPRDYARADAARPVLHFTGRADMKATALWLRLVCEAFRDARKFPPQGYLLRLGSLMKTLEPPHDC